MQLASVLLARVYALVPIEELNPVGHVYYPDVAAALVERYGFQKYPTTFAEFDESKGIEFQSGKWEGIVIDKVVILNNGIYIDTSAHTDASEAILQDALQWATSAFGIKYSPDMIKRRAYVSQVTFVSDAPLLTLAIHPVLRGIAREVSGEVRQHFGSELDYEPIGIHLMYDQFHTSFGPGAFSIQRREGVPFIDNKFFSAAPLKTDVHVNMLEEIERSVIKPKKSAALHAE